MPDEDLLRSRGLRVTRPRLAVLEVLTFWGLCPECRARRATDT